MIYVNAEDDVVDAFFAGELVRLCPAASSAQKRTLHLLVQASLASDRSGSTRLPLSGEASILEDHVRALGASGDEIASVREFADSLVQHIALPFARVFGTAADRKPLLVVDDCLYHERVYVLESAFVAALRDRFNTKSVAPMAALADAISSIEKSTALSSEQKRGVERALTSPFTLITGGPGTGKTALAVSILRALARLRVPMTDVAVAAPTGRAAQRMVDAMSRSLRALPSPQESDALLLASLPAPSTLHRLLEYSQRAERFQRHERNPIPAKYVIVDEGSMIDLVLATRLVRSLRSDAHLILLGDAQQLPSVETGAVFRDLVRAAEGQQGLPHLIRLTKSYRMDLASESGKHVFDFAAHVLLGDVERAVTHAHTRKRAAEIGWQGVEHIAVAEAAHAVDRFFDEHLALPSSLAERASHTFLLDRSGELRANDAENVRSLLTHYDSARVLTATRAEGNELSAARVNRRLHARALAAAGSRLSDAGDEVELQRGQPVMMQRNDYARGLFNGDQGVVLRVLAHGFSEPHDACVFATSSGLIASPLDSIKNDIALSYATTVHKAQGSEFDRVLVLLPNANLPILTRDLLYTAVTRARTSVVLVADPESLARTVSRRTERFSGVAERLLPEAFSLL
ncbi:MAG: exodeoxyribonuclease V subunit alpha [Sandaracinaceae bacterium]|nr:exodeoxyribonuclease V subunit alpha [Sandaracinaceae bacterium]